VQAKDEDPVQRSRRRPAAAQIAADRRRSGNGRLRGAGRRREAGDSRPGSGDVRLSRRLHGFEATLPQSPTPTQSVRSCRAVDLRM
jgi:hypothetical protein